MRRPEALLLPLRRSEISTAKKKKNQLLVLVLFFCFFFCFFLFILTMWGALSKMKEVAEEATRIANNALDPEAVERSEEKAKARTLEGESIHSFVRRPWRIGGFFFFFFFFF
jgi:hypothetical protein